MKDTHLPVNGKVYQKQDESLKKTSRSQRCGLVLRKENRNY